MICSNCGKEVGQQTRFCEICGSPIVSQMVPQTQLTGKKENETADNTIIFMLAYLSILFFLPLLVCPKSKEGRFHANQGLVLLIASSVCSLLLIILNAILTAIDSRLWLITLFLVTALFIAWLCLVITGIKNVKAGEKKPLPIIGNPFIIL